MTHGIHSRKKLTDSGKAPTLSGSERKPLSTAVGVALLLSAASLHAAEQIIIDHSDSASVTISGTWSPSTAQRGYHLRNYLHDHADWNERKSVSFHPSLQPGSYTVFGRWTQHQNRSTAVPVEIVHAGGLDTVVVDQTANGNQWVSLGTYNFDAGDSGSVTIANGRAPGYVIADAVKFVRNADRIIDHSSAADVTISGQWSASRAVPGYHGQDYLHDGNVGKGSKSVEYHPDLGGGRYAVSMRWTADANRASNVPVTIHHDGGSDRLTVNQRTDGGRWVDLGTYSFGSGSSVKLSISNEQTNGHVIADAVRFTHAGGSVDTPGNPSDRFSRNDILMLFESMKADGTVSGEELADLRFLASAEGPDEMHDGVRWLLGQVAQGAYAGMSAERFEEDLVGPWFRGTRAPLPQFRNMSLTHSEIAGSLYGPSGEPRIGDIAQGNFGNCTFLAALGASFGPQSNDAGAQTSALVKDMITDNGDGTFMFRFFADNAGTAEYVTVDRRVLTRNGNIFGAKANNSTNPSRDANIIWVTLAERAYAQWTEWRYNYLYGGYQLTGSAAFHARPLTALNGRPVVSLRASQVSFEELVDALSKGQAMTVERASVDGNTSFILAAHAYSVTNAFINEAGEKRVVVRNPWGRDGRTRSGANDGFIDLSYDEFRSTFTTVLARVAQPSS